VIILFYFQFVGMCFFGLAFQGKILILNDNKTSKTKKKIQNYNFFCFVQGANLIGASLEKRKNMLGNTLGT
jgi:hypothetical protein